MSKVMSPIFKRMDIQVMRYGHLKVRYFQWEGQKLPLLGYNIDSQYGKAKNFKM